ncbi:hypothetical protein [Microbispora bryophytorum]|uniref:hypothetical protein n=1 Tax=Microbispora bryophytorum TaxID=1460882 RepID=UPI0033F0782E
MPGGMRRVTSQQEFQRAVKEQAAALALRSDAYRNLVLVASTLSNWADWTTMTSRPTEQRIAQDTGLSISTVKRWVRWLRERGFLGVVEEGTTVRFRKGTRCGLDDDGLGNRAAVWVLCVPAPAELDEHNALTDKTTTEPPSRSSSKEVQESPTHARGTRSTPHRRDRSTTTTEPAATPGTRKHARRQALQIAEETRHESITLRGLTAWYVRHLIRDFVAAGWTARDVLYALDHTPDGTAWTYTWTSRDELRNVPGWVRFRLAAWRDEHGRPVPSRSQRLAAEAAEQRAQQESWRRELEEQRARAGLASAKREPVLSRAEALAPPPATPAVGSAPNNAFRAARAALEAKRLQRELMRLRLSS